MAVRSAKRLLDRALAWLLIAVVGSVALAAAFGAWQVFTKAREAKRERDIAAENLADLEARKASLTEKLDALDTARGVEEEVRSRYPLVKPGETVITIINPKSGSAGASAPAEKGLWTTITSWFSW